MHIKLNDNVRILTGADGGVSGKVLVVDHHARKVTVEGVNKVWKHVRRSQRNPQGGRLSKEMPVPMSNVMLICTACNTPSRTGNRYTKDGAKERFCKRCGAGQGEIAPPKAAYAKQK